MIRARIVRLLAAALVLTALASGPAPADQSSARPAARSADGQGPAAPNAPADRPGDGLAEVRARGALRIGIKEGMPPFGFRDPAGGDLKGFEPDLARAVAQRLGVEPRLEPIDARTRIPALVEGRLDLVAAGMAHTFSRDEMIDFSTAYFLDGVRLLTAGGSGIGGADDLKGRTVAVAAGDAAAKAVTTAQPDCALLPMDGYPQAFLALKQGQADALAADASVLLFLKNADSEPKRWAVVGPVLLRRPVAMGLAENQSDLRDAVNRALADMWRGGQFRRIYQRWFGPGTDYHLPLDWDMETWPP